MTREEQLKQAIEKSLPFYPEDDFNTKSTMTAARAGYELCLKTPSILIHADPDIMKQAGWVREEEWISVEELTYPDHETIMAYSPDMPQYPLFGFFNSNNVFTCLYNMDLPKYYQVTHWKPLPQPPNNKP